MPSRFNIKDDVEIHSLLSALNVNLGVMPERYNLAPTDQVPVIHQWEGQRIISDMRWWLVPNWSGGPSTKYPMFNAQKEKLNSSRAFQGCFRHKRCIIPAHSFIEWQHSNNNKTPYLFSVIDSAIAFAGLWDYWTDGIQHVLSCAIVTTDAAPEFELYHNKMPVMLSPNDAELWLNLKQDFTTDHRIFEPTLLHHLNAVEIDSKIGSVQNKSDPILIGKKVLLT